MLEAVVVVGWLLVAFGLLYLLRPDLYRRWFWRRTSMSQRMSDPDSYLLSMPILGAGFVVGGVWILLTSH